MAAAVLRKGACIIVDPAATDAAQLAAEVAGSLRAWARDPELYALVVDTRRLDAATHVADGAWRAVADMLWRLDCFSKPTVTLLGQEVGALAVAIGLVGTHRAISPDARLLLGSDDARVPLPPLVRWASAQLHRMAVDDMDKLIVGLADAEPVDPLLDDAGAVVTGADVDHQPLSDVTRETLAALATGGDLRALTLALDALRGDPTPWSLPPRAELQSLRGTLLSSETGVHRR